MRSTASASRSAKFGRSRLRRRSSAHAPRLRPSQAARISDASSATTRSSGRRTAQEAGDEEQLVGVLGCERRLARAPPRRGPPRPRASRRAPRERARRHASRPRRRTRAGTPARAPGRGRRARAARAGRARRSASTTSSSAASRSRSRAASSKRRSRGEAPQLRAQRREHGREVVALERRRAPRGELRACACSRSARARRLRDGSPAGSAAREVDVPVGPPRSRVRRRAELAKQPELLERSLELRAELAPLDPLERAERGLDGRSLAVAGEVRAEPRAEVARLADVEHGVVAVAEEIDARRRRRPRDERALRVQPACPRRGQLDEVGDRPGAALLREPEQRDQDLGRRERVGQRAMARLATSCRRSARAAGARSARSGGGAAAARATPCRRPAPRPVGR